MQEDAWLHDRGILDWQNLLHVEVRHQENLPRQLHVVVLLEGLRGLRRPQDHETSAEIARNQPDLWRGCRPYLHGLQHQMMENNVGQLQGYLQEDPWLQNR